MRNKPKILVMAGALIIVLVSAGIHISNQVSHFPNQFGISLLDQDKGAPVLGVTKLLEAIEGESGSLQSNQDSNAKTGSLKVSETNPQADTSQNGNENLINHVQNKIGQPIAKKDVLIAGLILMRKLSAEDISYLSRVAMKDSYSQEDYRKSQEILLKKLSADDINTLKKLGKKYGSEVKILSQN
jgi:hypothetical protein